VQLVRRTPPVGEEQEPEPDLRDQERLPQREGVCVEPPWIAFSPEVDAAPPEGEEVDESPEAETKGRPIAVTRPSELLDAVLAAGRKGLSIQRYKGLGEMNAEQLWETTLDPANRSLLRVEVAQADVADEIFTRLMGDVVEPRREFIQDNALNVANLDV